LSEHFALSGNGILFSHATKASLIVPASLPITAMHSVHPVLISVMVKVFAKGPDALSQIGLKPKI
jgi:hypothetical protein